MAYIMVIDDDMELANEIALVLRKEGHETEIQLDIDSAFKSIQQRHPDLMVLDIMFPDNRNGGFDLAHRIRNMEQGKNPVPVLILSSINSKFPFQFNGNDIDEEWMPVDEFLDKPVDHSVLVEKIKGLLDQHLKFHKTR